MAPDGASLTTDAVVGTEGAFREQGTISLGSDGEVRLRTLGTGRLVRTAGSGVRRGTVTWEVDGGTGRFAKASGRITSLFTITDGGDVVDEQQGVVVLDTCREEQP
jgi:hypothetical protein